MREKTKMLLPTYTGALIGFLVFLAIGAIPGLLYGGYMGLTMLAALTSSPIEPTIIAKVMTGGGMLIGLLASVSFFVVIGSLIGTVIGAPISVLLSKKEKAPNGTQAQKI